MTTTRPSLLTLAEAVDTCTPSGCRCRKAMTGDDTIDRLNELAEEIRVAPATMVEGAAAKARNLLWAFGLTHTAVPALEDDAARYELAAFVAELERWLTSGSPRNCRRTLDLAEARSRRIA